MAGWAGRELLNMVGPLDGVRVLDLTTFLSGPLATHVLADLGAEVIKVEPPSGDPTRAGSGMKPGEPPSPFWVNLHRDRKSVALDLKSDAARGVFFDLVAHADVVVENFSPGVTTRLGIDYEALRRRNPAIIYCSISGFGSAGPYSQMVAIDGPVQAFAGMVEVGGSQGGPATIVPMQVADIAGAMAGAQGVLAALYARERTGVGTHIDLSLLESLLQWLMVTDRKGSMAPPVTMVLDCADGRQVLVQTPLHFQGRLNAVLAAVPGFEDFVADERFATLDGRRAHLDDYLAGVRRAFHTRSSTEWLAVLQQAGVPVGPVERVERTLGHPQMAFRGATTTLDMAGRDPETVLASHFLFNGERKTETLPPPTLGQHTGELLADLLGYDQARIEELADGGAFGVGRSA